MMPFSFLASLALLISPVEPTTRDQDRVTEVLLLAVYHFDNPGLDKYKHQLDDYFSERRQQEIVEVVDRLVAFSPQKIFVERHPGAQGFVDEHFADYCSDAKTLEQLPGGRSEVFQLGFRLARRLGHARVIAADSHGFYLGPEVDEVAHRAGLDFYREHEEDTAARVRVEDELMAQHTVLENLIDMNHPDSIARSHYFYNSISPRVVDPDAEQGSPLLTQEIEGKEHLLVAIDNHHIGPDLTAEWYKRNIRIYGNILRQISADDERVLVIFGQGHAGALRHFFQDNPHLELVHTNDYLE